MALVNWGAGREAEAQALLESARASNPDLIMARTPLVILYQSQDRSTDAQAVSREILAVNPAFTAEAAMRYVPLGVLPDGLDREQAVALLRAGGLP